MTASEVPPGHERRATGTVTGASVLSASPSDPVPVTPDKSDFWGQLHKTVVSSAIAGVAARLACHPLDTLKSRVQNSDKSLSLRQVARQIIAENGWRGMYAGLGATLVGSAPGVALYLTTYEYLKGYLTPYGSSYPTFVHLFAGMSAEAVCGAVFIPVDVVKERLQVQSAADPSKYRNSLDAFRTILKQEGPRGLYRGYFVTLASFGPFSAIYFAIYEQCKQRITNIRAVTGKNYSGDGVIDRTGFFDNLLASAFAGGVASILTNPLEIVKLRYQVQRLDPITGKLPETLFQVTKSLYARQGWSGFLRGAGTRVVFQTPTTAITMAVYEKCLKHF